jgi:hypothetical protein
MNQNSLPSANDIEMILQSFIENRNQSFYINKLSSNETLSLSQAIKNPIIVYEKTVKKYDSKAGKEIEKTTYIIWKRNSNELIEKDNEDEMLTYVNELLNPEWRQL